jgi:WD40 repeat protein
VSEGAPRNGVPERVPKNGVPEGTPRNGVPRRAPRNGNWVSAVAFSPDSKLLASASSDKTVKLSDAGTGAALQTIEVDAVVQTLLFSDDSTFLETDRGLLRTTSNSLEQSLFDGTSQAVYLRRSSG